jgi:hypothetical protein
MRFEELTEMEDLVYQGGLSVIHVGNDGNIENVFHERIKIAQRYIEFICQCRGGNKNTLSRKTVRDKGIFNWSKS